MSIDSDYYRLIGNCRYRKNPCEKTAKKSLEDLKNSIRELNFIDSSSFEYAMEDAFNTIMLMYEMQEEKHIHYDAAKESLNQLYVYNAEKREFNLPALRVSFDIKDYELCSKIALNIINNYPLDEEEYKMVLEYYIKSLHYLEGDNHKKIINELNKIDFNISKIFLTDIINEIAGNIVIDNSIEIKNKKVLISLYEIMSFSRKELIVIRLLDYVRNANDYFKKYTKNKKDKDKNWKGETVDIKYKEKKYKLCYSHNSYKEEKGYNSDDYIAINQIRDTLSHGEHKCKVNENVKEAKNAREFIEANFTSIIECLFNVIKENNLLSDSKFDSEDF